MSEPTRDITVTFSFPFLTDNDTYAKWTDKQINAEIARLLNRISQAWATKDALALSLAAHISDNNAFDHWGFKVWRFGGKWCAACAVEMYGEVEGRLRVYVARETAARAIAEVCLHWLTGAKVEATK